MENGGLPHRLTLYGHFFQALKELKAEGGIEARYRRYCRNHEALVEGMRAIGFSPCWNRKAVSGYTFFLIRAGFFVYRVLWVAETTGVFVIYPGKVSDDTFGLYWRCIPGDFERLTQAVAAIRQVN